MQIVTTLLEIIAAALVVFGVWLMFPPAAFVVAGLSLLAMSWGVSRPPAANP